MIRFDISLSFHLYGQKVVFNSKIFRWLKGPELLQMGGKPTNLWGRRVTSGTGSTILRISLNLALKMFIQTALKVII